MLNLPEPNSSSAAGEASVQWRLLLAPTQAEWIARCCVSILQAEPLLAEADVLDLAAALWERPHCRDGLPELAAVRLLAGELRRL